MDWYDFLIKPPFTPPDHVFMIVWPVLYTMMGVAFLFVLRTARSKEKSVGVFCFMAQLFFNFLWSPVFFAMKSPTGALFVLVLLLLFLLLTIFFFYKQSKTAAFLLLPYAGWSLFALYLNAGIIVLN